ncbi:MAG: ATP-binding cassette domain-containing protein [Anaerolineae bacterium]|nr:ATP-binding cassette domain-containing protein [Anaerolineae bacterium]
MEILRTNNLSRYFGAVPALVEVSLELQPGEVLGIVGQRGAGKSTLFNLLSGLIPPSSGEIIYAGKHVLLHDALHAQRLGIATVPQYPQFPSNLNTLRSIFLGREIRRPGALKALPDDGAMAQRAREMLASFDQPPELLEERVANLSDEQRQIIALARALYQPDYHLLLLDEALAALSFSRQEAFLERIKSLAAQGITIIMGSDDLKQIFAVTNRILVLYQGRPLAIRRTAETTPREIVELVVGSNRQERITPMIWAFENYHAAQQQAEELRRDQLELRQNLRMQDSLNQQLIERLHNQVEALDRLNVALQEASRRLITEREAERKALARELHDQVIQDLLSYNYQLEETENSLTEEEQRRDLIRIRQGVRQVVGSLREICSDLRPPTIDNHGLSAAIRSLTSQWTEQTGIPIKLEIDPSLGRLPEPIELGVYRIIQEGLSNIRKHANATHVSLALKRTSAASLSVRLIDNGRGLTQPLDLATLTTQKHFGLVGISERLSLIGGTLKLTSAPSGGLEMNFEIPSPYPTIGN